MRTHDCESSERALKRKARLPAGDEFKKPGWSFSHKSCRGEVQDLEADLKIERAGAREMGGRT